MSDLSEKISISKLSTNTDITRSKNLFEKSVDNYNRFRYETNSNQNFVEQL